MIDIVNKIVEIDKEAREKLDKALEEKEKIISKALEDKNILKKELSERALKRIEAVRSTESQQLEDNLRLISDKKYIKIHDIDLIFEKKSKIWESEIYKNILGESL